MRQAIVPIAFLVLSLAALPGRADDQDVIDYRQHIMKTMGEQMGAISMILQNKAPPDNFAVHLKVLAITATQAKSAFEPKVPGGDAKPGVWTDWQDFSHRLDELVAATAELAASAQRDGVAKVGAKMQSTVKCKGCHDTYRVPKK
jgi:cytochrome c556